MTGSPDIRSTTSPSESELRLRLAVEATGIGIFDYDLLRGTLEWDARTREMFGIGPSEPVSYEGAFLPGVHPDDREATDRMVRKAIDPSGSGSFLCEYRTVDRRGRLLRWVAARGRLVVDDGIATRFVGTVRDITAEKFEEGAQGALIALADRLRDARSPREVGAAAAETLGRTLGVERSGFAVVDAVNEAFRVEQDWTAGGAGSLAGHYPLSALPACVRWMRRGEPLILSDAQAEAAFAQDGEGCSALRARAQVKIPLIRHGDLFGWLYVHGHDPRAWTPREVGFAKDVSERTWAALARLWADEQQRFLNRELSHRLKNNLTMAQAIVSQTLRNVAGMDEVKESLVSRLVALGKAHDVLLEGESESAHIHAIIAGALAIHDDRERDRLSLNGPQITLGPKAALALALMIHELATNAVKYGALSVPSGRVGVDWSVADLAGDPVMSLVWTESDGPAVVAPSKKGFGSRLIERGLSSAVGGEAIIEYAPAGVVCRMSASLSGLLSRD